MNLKIAIALRAAVPENLRRPPALEISAAPNADQLHMRKFERAIDPTATAPFRRAHIPIGVVIERDDNHRLAEASNPEGSQVMKIAGAVEQKGRKLRFELAIKFFN